MVRNSLLAGMTGYWGALLCGKNKIVYTLLAITGSAAYYLVNEWRLSGKLRSFDYVDFNYSIKLPQLRTTSP